jgi:hypothetical protein
MRVLMTRTELFLRHDSGRFCAKSDEPCVRTPTNRRSLENTLILSRLFNSEFHVRDHEPVKDLKEFTGFET